MKSLQSKSHLVVSRGRRPCAVQVVESDLGRRPEDKSVQITQIRAGNILVHHGERIPSPLRDKRPPNMCGELEQDGHHQPGDQEGGRRQQEELPAGGCRQVDPQVQYSQGGAWIQLADWLRAPSCCAQQSLVQLQGPDNVN